MVALAAALGVHSLDAWADDGPGRARVALLSAEQMQRVGGEATVYNARCSAFDSVYFDCTASACSLTGADECQHRQTFRYGTCVGGYQCQQCDEATSGKCYRQRYCDSDSEQCNYGSPNPAEWWCKAPAATCGSWTIYYSQNLNQCGDNPLGP